MLEQIHFSHANPLSRTGAIMRKGWSNDVAMQLLEHADGKDQVPFTTVKDADEWYQATTPIVYSLAQTAEPAGVIWYATSEYDDSIGEFELYPYLSAKAHTRGYAEPFSGSADADFRSSYDPRTVWLETKSSDSTTRNLYLKLGYGIIRATNSHITLRR